MYDGLGTDPLSAVHARDPWTQPNGPVSIGEIDVVGYPWQTLASPLPSGVRLIGARRVGDYLVARFSLAAPQRLTRSRDRDPRRAALLGPGPAGAAVLVQHASTSG